MPSTGHFVRVFHEYAGLGGDVNHVRKEIEAQVARSNNKGYVRITHDETLSQLLKQIGFNDLTAFVVVVFFNLDCHCHRQVGLPALTGRQKVQDLGSLFPWWTHVCSWFQVLWTWPS